MYEFHWRAYSSRSQKCRGIIVAINKNTAKNILLQQGYSKIKLSYNLNLQTQLSLQQQYDLLTQLAMLLTSGIPLTYSLSMLKDNSNNKITFLLLQQILTNLQYGFSFSQSIDKSPYNLLTTVELSLIKTAELTGKLTEIIQQISQQKLQTLKLKKQIQQLMFYPIIVLSIICLVSLAILLFIVPQFVLIYSSNQVTLPSSTQFIVFLSDCLRTQPIFSVLCLIFIYIGTHYLKKYWLHKFIRNIPVVKTIYQYQLLINFCRSLALMLVAGLDMKLALGSIINSQDAYYRQVASHILTGIQAGMTFASSLDLTLFNQQTQQMLALAEQSSNLQNMLVNIAINYQDKLTQQIQLLTKLIEPLLMLLIGIVVALLLVALYQPIFNLGNSI